MARRGSITEEQVFAAADALVAQSREVTPTALLSALGSGSFSTIYKHLNAWEASRAAAVTDKAAVIPESVLAAFGAAWRAAAAEAGKEVVTVREQTAQEVEAAKAQFQEALQTIERLEAENESDATRIEELTARIAEMEKSLHQSESEKAALKATAEQLRHQVRSQEAELERLHKDADAERKRHQDELAKAQPAASSAQDKANAQIEKLQHELSELRTKVEKSERERTEAEFKAREASNRAEKADEQVQKTSQESALTRKEREDAIKQAAELRGKVETLQAQNNELLSRLSGQDKPKKS